MSRPVADRPTKRPACPVRNDPSAAPDAERPNELPITDCRHLRLLAVATRGHRNEWEAKRG